MENTTEPSVRPFGGTRQRTVGGGGGGERPRPPRPPSVTTGQAKLGQTLRLRVPTRPAVQISRPFPFDSAPPCCRGAARRWEFALACAASLRREGREKRRRRRLGQRGPLLAETPRGATAPPPRPRFSRAPRPYSLPDTEEAPGFFCDPPASWQLPGSLPQELGDRHCSARKMGAGSQQPGAPVGKSLPFPGRRESPCWWLGGGGGCWALRSLLGLFLHLWLSAASGSSAQLFNLSLSVDEGLPPDTLVGDIRAGLPAAQQLEGSGFFLSEDSDDSPLLDDFHVHPDTGIIRTARCLDRERWDHYSFVAATLLGAVVQVDIRVNDVNDHSPRFPRDSLQLDVSELTPPGTAFRLPGAQDPDAGLFSTQGYTLVQPANLLQYPEGPFFQLRYVTPGLPPSPLLPGSPSVLDTLDLVLLRRLDREAAAAHELQIEAWDGGRPPRTGRLRVELRVLDENDNPPVFELGEYRAAVREDAAPGAEVCRVRATDRDLGPNGHVRYRIRTRQMSGASGGGGSLGDAAYFAVEEQSGVVRVLRPLDREAQAWHQLVVEARDGGTEPEVATVRLAIAVLDVNDNPPSIHLLFLTEGGAASVSEGARPGDYVARVSVSDADCEPEKLEEAAGQLGVGLGDGSISLSLEGGEGAFALRPGGPPGVFFLCVEGPLDRESRDLYELRLVATDAGSPPLNSEETLLLRVADLNDQPPLFSQEQYRASVSEAAAPGTAVVWVSATDADEAGTEHATLRYMLIQLSPPCNSEALSTAECGPSFTIDPKSAVISTIRTLDREVQEVVELRVVAQDLGEPPLSATCLVSITVDDVNDNEPVFQRQVYNATLAEHAPVGHCFLQVKASDADAGLYGFVEYTMYDGFQSYEAPQAFRIDPRDGHICVSKDIDRERDPAIYDLLVKAKDGGGLSAQAFVRVELEDVNDNHPMFNPSTYVTSISAQTQPGTEIINVLATDQDSGVYGTVAYELLPGELSSLFTIDSTTGIIYLTSTLSHLESTTLLLMVCARDGGGLTAVVSADVTIHIIQTILAPAEFERPKYTFSIYEDVPEDSPVGTVKASEPLNSSEPIFYRISSGDLDGKFSIHPWLGTIRTQKPLDHETQPVVVLTVQAQLGSSPACSSTEVNITVIDVNDNHPVFLTASEEIKISQTTAPGTALYLAHAEDRDSGLNGFVQYAIASQGPSIFAVDAGLGVLYLNRSLGGHGPWKHVLSLVAQDLGVPPRATLLVLTVVIEKPEQVPSLTFEHLVYQAEVSESLSLMTHVLQVQALPLGVQRAAASRPVYSLEPCRDSAVFAIRPYTGWIYLQRQLDYESTQTYNFRVFAWIPEDRLLQNVSTSVIVHVLDENDNSPTFLHDVLFLKVEESPAPQGVIGKITAIDADSGKNGQLLYFLLSDGKFFKMNPNTGELVSWVALDREHQMHYEVTVLVTDRGSPSRNATMTVYVSVTDINDNRPFFPQYLHGKELHIKVLEGQPVNMLVTTVFAKDLDEGNNAEVIYSVSSEDGSDHFKIDANSGEIRTTTILSCDYRPSYRMTVIASDQGAPPLQGHAVIHIQVIPLFKGKAIISQNIRHLVIPENLKPAKIMSLIKSPDHRQQHYNGQFQFSIVADDKDGFFEIDSFTGDLFLSKELDYETTSHYLFRVITIDHSKNPPLNSTVFLSIDVEDQNDHSPSFQHELIVISVEENAPIGTLVYVFNAKDGDGSFLNSRIQYFIESHHSGMNPFLIHPSFGTLVTASPLDRESMPAVLLTVTASDQAVNVTDRRLRSLMAKVVILDVNDHSPTFKSFPIAHVKEDAMVGSLVHHITAQDPDEGRNGKVTYSILSGNEDMAFVLDESSGLLTTACPLDYEIKTQHVLMLLALDGGVPALSASQTLTITVLDVNDEVPVFRQHLYEVSVKENRNPGEFVTRVEAVDRDSGINSRLHFEILPGPSLGLFEINSETGEVVTNTTLDREVQEIFTLRVLVRDGGVPSLSSTTTILCIVEDENDHAPEFIVPSHDIEILENQEPEVVYAVLASDMDAGNNKAIKYYITDGNTDEYFAINETSGELSTTRALDRERVNNFTLVILCSDLGDPPKSSVTQLQVRVLDDNDHSPAFPTLYYQSSVREDAEVGTVVLKLSAVDKDEGPNGQIEYFLMDEASGAFTIDPVEGTLRTSHTLDREARSLHTFKAVARDCSTRGSRSTTVIIKVHVSDVNDNNPVWEQNPFDVFLSSQSPTNQIAAMLKADDPDLGPNGTVIFSFAETQSLFSIDKYTGEIQLQQNPSSEYFPMWLQLKVTDQGVPARTTTGLLVLHMEGEDVKISFSHQLYKGLVAENCNAGTSIVTIKAFASDSIQDSIKYSIFNGNEDGVFSLCSNSGQLTVKEPKFLDFEVRNEVRLTVLAESGRHRAYSKVAVLIEDVNDNQPHFEPSVYQASVSEGQFYKAHVLQVFATDLDSGLNGLIEYSIISGNQEEAFQIDALSGVITANAILDYEFTSSYSLIVQATDKGTPRLSDTTVIKIQVTDINDNAPAFLSSEAVEIAENFLPGVIVTQVSVHDMDLNPAFIFSFTPVGNPGTKFTIDRNTGVVMLVETLDFEEVAEYELQIRVSDSVHHTVGALLVCVLDVNDNPPVFSQDVYQVTVPESVPVGYSVLTVSATDVENSENISYRIQSSSKAFSIDPMNGTIFTITPVLDKISTIQLLVEASDGGLPDLKALTLVEIEIQDVNDHAPEFTVEFYNLSLREDTPIGNTLVTFSTIDHDWTRENTYVEYSIVSGNSQNYFHVETHFIHSVHPYKQVGYLVLLHSLDREATARHKLVILASDHGYSPLSSTTIISIEVLDVNDNSPKFSSLDYYAHVKESTPLGSHITVVSAEDHDVGSHAEIFYHITSGDEKGHFYLEEKTGVLYLSKLLDYEEIIKFTLTVQASDKEKKHFSFAVVFVNVLDDNDHVPQFLFSSFNCVAPENLPVFSTVCSVNALDFDAGPYGELTYSILSPCFIPHEMSSDHDLFFIDPLTGDIHAKQILDYENGDKYCLTVQAKDRGGSTASLMVWVDIEGIDEFEPIFTQEQYFFTLSEKNKVKQLIGRVEASDADAGIDGIILYSLGTSSPFFLVNKTNGNIYLIRALPPIKSQISKEDTMEMKIIAHSPKPGSKFASCKVFVNVSLSSEGMYAAGTTNSFSVSLTISCLVFLLLVCILIVLILRHKQKDTTSNYEEKETSSSLDINLRVSRDATVLKGFPKTNDYNKEAGLVDLTPEWLSLISIVEKDFVNLHRHSNSSGHCSVDGETVEDKEIRRINEHPYRKDSDSPLSDRDSRVPDSGIPRDSDQLSCLSGETDVMVTAETAEANRAFEEGEREEGCSTTYVQKRETREGILAEVRKESVFPSGDQETRCVPFATQITSDQAGRGSYHWDYLLSWEPRFQPLASVFNDIAKLKDEHLHTPGIPKEKKSFVFPPPLITAVAQPGIKAVPPRMPAVSPGQVLQKHPRSPIPYHLGSPPKAMTPSFSPSLSLLTMRTPAVSPLVSGGELVGIHLSGTCYELKAEDEAQI
ncbi:protocadherin-23 [Nycticebus coucang]|uniref:protocadherin-23 n=1 Tax=Nycticebus coucang TaxID=9470 RepID=UPI00234C52FA|nr:protocadherin-23 [Nycticebus coucang]